MIWQRLRHSAPLRGGVPSRTLLGSRQPIEQLLPAAAVGFSAACQPLEQLLPAAALLFSVACRLPSTIPDDRVDPILTPPLISTLDVTCDPDASERAVALTATSWTGGANWYLTADGAYVERHYVRSQSAAADGSSDTLGLTVSIVGDGQDASSGSSTAFLCSDAPSWRLVLYDAYGSAITDCRTNGDTSVWTSQPDVPACDIPFEDSDTAG